MFEKIIICSMIVQMSIQTDVQNDNPENCRERNRLITSEKGDLYALVDATVGEKLIMQCHYWYVNFEYISISKFIVAEVDIVEHKTFYVRNRKFLLKISSKEMDDTRPKIWYNVAVLGLSEPKEVKVTMDNDISKNRIQLTSDHSLIILNFTNNDTGLYYCMAVEELDVPEKINYLVDRKYKRYPY